MKRRFHLTIPHCRRRPLYSSADNVHAKTTTHKMRSIILINEKVDYLKRASSQRIPRSFSVGLQLQLSNLVVDKLPTISNQYTNDKSSFCPTITRGGGG